MTSYIDSARMQSIRTQRQFEEMFLLTVRDLLHNAMYYRRMARIARARGETILHRELAIRAMAAEADAHMLAIDSHLTVNEMIARQA